MASGDGWKKWSSGYLTTRQKATEGMSVSRTILEISSERSFKMTNSGNIYYLKYNTDFPLFLPGREVELFTSEETALFLGKIAWWAPFYINDAPTVLKDRMKKRELNCTTLKINWHLGNGHWCFIVGYRGLSNLARSWQGAWEEKTANVKVKVKWWLMDFQE